MRSTGTPARRTTWRYLRPESTSRPTLGEWAHVREADRHGVLDPLADLERGFARPFQIAGLVELECDAARRDRIAHERQRVNGELGRVRVESACAGARADAERLLPAPQTLVLRIERGVLLKCLFLTGVVPCRGCVSGGRGTYALGSSRPVPRAVRWPWSQRWVRPDGQVHCLGGPSVLLTQPMNKRRVEGVVRLLRCGRGAY